MPLPAAAVTLGALLAPYKVLGDVVFVAIMFTAGLHQALWPSRNDVRHGHLHVLIVTFMSYFFWLFLGATTSMLPWLIIAPVIGDGVQLRDARLRPPRSAGAHLAPHAAGVARPNQGDRGSVC